MTDFPTHETNPGGNWVAPSDSYARLRSGPFNGSVATRWTRDNSGHVCFRCPICGGLFPDWTRPGEIACLHPWARDHSGFRYRFIAPPNAALVVEGE